MTLGFVPCIDLSGFVLAPHLFFKVFVQRACFGVVVDGDNGGNSGWRQWVRGIERDLPSERALRSGRELSSEIGVALRDVVTVALALDWNHTPPTKFIL